MYRSCTEIALTVPRRLGERGGEDLYSAGPLPARQFGVSTSNKSRLVVAKKHHLSPLFVWRRLRIHHASTVILGTMNPPRPCFPTFNRPETPVPVAKLQGRTRWYEPRAEVLD